MVPPVVTNNLEAIDSVWFSNPLGYFGFVAGKDVNTGERILFAGVATGADQKADEQFILNYGCKVNIGMMLHIIAEVSPPPQKKKKKPSK